jgi:hypothetical protein
MTNTGETLEKLKEFKKEIESKSVSEYVTFNVEDIDIVKDRMYVNSVMISESGTKRVLSHLRVKNNFLALSETLTSTDWANVKDALKKPTAAQIVHGRNIATFVGDTIQTVIDDIHMAAPKSTGLLEFDTVINLITDSIVSTGKDMSLKSTAYLDDKDEMVVTLIENDQTLDIFSDEKEIWKIGKRIVWNAMNFSIFAFFERADGSGVTIPKYGFRSNVSNNKFNLEKIKQVLEKEVTLNSQEIDGNFIDSANHLKSKNISVREFSRYRSFFNQTQHPEIMEKWFSDSKMNKAYNCIATDMPGIWQATADSGINAFEFFKQVIYAAAFPEKATPEPKEGEEVEEVKLSSREKYDLEIKASEILLKKELDLEIIAPKGKWS